MPIKTVHITNYYHKNSGGISTAYNSLLVAAKDHKRYVRLIVPGEREEVEDVNDFARIYCVPAHKAFAFDKRYRVIMPWDYMLSGSLIRKILIDEMPQMVEIRDKYTLSMFGAMVKRNKFKDLNRCMLVHYSSERMDDNIASFIVGGRLSKWFAKRIMGNYNVPSFDFHLTNSPYTANEIFESTRKVTNPNRPEWFINLCWRFFRSPRIAIDERVHICPPGVDIARYSPDRKSEEIRKELTTGIDIRNDTVIVMYAGRVSPEKNVKLLPEIMEMLARSPDKDYRLVVAGAGPLGEWLQAETDKKIPGKIIQLGHLDVDTLANYYAVADVFIHPNPKEPFGIGPLEAMASGVPVVAPNSGGLTSYATHDNSWLVEPTAASFAKAIEEVVASPELRKAKMKNALKTAEENSLNKSTGLLFKTYDRLWEEFQTRNELFTDEEATKRFDFRPLMG